MSSLVIPLANGYRVPLAEHNQAFDDTVVCLPCPQLFDLLHQFFLRMLDVDFVDAKRSLHTCDASIA
jgi:hypothetical protein